MMYEVTFSLPTAKPIRLMHSMVFPRRRRSESVVAFCMMYFRQGMNLETQKLCESTQTQTEAPSHMWARSYDHQIVEYVLDQMIWGGNTVLNTSLHMIWSDEWWRRMWTTMRHQYLKYDSQNVCNSDHLCHKTVFTALISQKHDCSDIKESIATYLS